MSDLNKQSRRNFLQTATLGSIAALSLPGITSAAAPKGKRKITLDQNDIILFQGDSITDARRNRDEKNIRNGISLGAGYAFLAASEILYKNPRWNLKVFNRGIGGDKVPQLAARWDRDCLALKPTVLSILVGVNDYWHTITKGFTGTVKSYESDFRSIIDRAKQANPDLKLIIGEPFGLAGIKGNYENWGAEFKEYQRVAFEVASSFDAAFIPYQQIFDEALKSGPADFWLWDGVHPTHAGSKLMADSWLSVVKY